MHSWSTKCVNAILLLLLEARQKGQSCPTCGKGGDELVRAMREAALEVFLNRFHAGDDMPGAVQLLCLHQKPNRLPPGLVADRQTASLMQRGEHRPRSVSVRRQPRALRPTALRSLRG